MIKHNLYGTRSQHGFTLVELAVVIGVMGILATVGIMSYVQVQKQTRDSTRQGDMTTIQSQLEKFYDDNGVYPPGCPQPTCTTWFLTENTASPIITPSMSLASVQAILPRLPSTFGDPATKGSNPFMDITTAVKQYFYYGGTINNRASASAASYGPTASFPCTIQSALSPSQAGSYVIGYYSEVTNSWVLNGGKRGIPMTVTSGNASDGCVINT